MFKASIALNRFGLGGRADDAPPADPKRWLIGQLDRFEARTPAIAALPPTRVIAAELADHVEQGRMQKREAVLAGEMLPGRPAKPKPGEKPTMSGEEAEAAKKRDPLFKARQAARRQARGYYWQAVGARTETALVAPAPFAERLVHFWANHFAVSADQAAVVGLAGPLEFEAIRPHLLGKFSDMLHAVERHPAMLLYLDQVRSLGPNSEAGQLAADVRPERRLGINENLAREIMELHTLGVRSVYTQADVTEFARALTGWTVGGLAEVRRARLTATGGDPGTFVFAPALHEPGTRTILGKSWPQSGEDQASAVLDMLATHPATARHVATKLARHFAGDEPPPALVGRLEAGFLRTGGDLPSLYRTLVEAPECWAPQPVKFKAPWEWAISAYRALGTRTLDPQAVTGMMTQLGQPIWKPGSPAGWDDVAASWAAPDALMRRVEAADRMAGRGNAAIDAPARAAKLFPGALSGTTAQAIARAESPAQGVALMLVAPEFLRR